MGQDAGGVREKVGRPERRGDVKLEFMGKFCQNATGGIGDGKIREEGEGARVLLL